MSKCTNIIHPLERSGTCQKDRLSTALKPESFQLSGQSTNEMISFAYQLATCLNYYNEDDLKDGNWRCFFDSEPSTMLAQICMIDTTTIACKFEALIVKFLQDHEDFLDDSKPNCNEFPDPENYKEIIDCLFKTFVLIHELCERIPSTFALKSEIREIIKKDLLNAVIDNKTQSFLNVLIAYDKGSFPAASFQKYHDFIIHPNCEVSDCVKIWGMDHEGFDCILPDNTYDLDKLRLMFQLLFKALSAILRRVKFYFQMFLQQDHAHQPHITLFLAFLELFKHLQEQLNDLVGKQFDYYYENILCFQKKNFAADQVHLVMELAKNYDTYKLVKGALLEAGKDAEGMPLYYELKEELVVTPASVAMIETSYIDPETSLIYSNSVEAPLEKGLAVLGMISEEEAQVGFAISSPEFNVVDGNRAVFIDLMMNDILPSDFNPSDKFELYYSTEADPKVGLEESWDLRILEPDDFDPGVSSINLLGQQTGFYSNVESTGRRTRVIRFKVFLSAEEGPVAAFENVDKDHQVISSPYPVFTIMAKRGEETYNIFKNNLITKVSIRVGVAGSTSLMLSNNTGVFDNASPYLLFGNDFRSGATAFLDHPAFRNSQVKNFGIDIDWKSGQPTQDVIIDFVDGRRIYPVSGGVGLAGLNNVSFELLGHGLDTFDELQMSGAGGLGPFDAGASPEELVVFSQPLMVRSMGQPLDTGFLNNIHRVPENIKPVKRALRLKLAANVAQDNLPEVNQIFLNYQSEVIIIDNKVVSDKDIPTERPVFETCFNVNPFGYKALLEKDQKYFFPPIVEVYADSSDSDDDPNDLLDINLSTATEFIGNFEDLEECIEDQIAESGDPSAGVPVNYFGNGNLDIGIRDLKPNQNLSILFLLDEGSEDHNFAPPDIELFYLANNNWYPFKAFEIINDTTKADPQSKKRFLGTGIVEFAIPEGINMNNTIKDSNMYWISARAVEKTDTESGIDESVKALPNLIGVYAQGVEAVFKNQNNGLQHLVEGLPAETISKLLDRPIAIKKILQPFASFGGVPVESSDQFYQRVSECLSHKGRAITPRDYERLLLAEFPKIHKAKCIPHTHNDHVLRPGYVAIGVIPGFALNAFNKLEPRVSAGTLDSIRMYLLDKTNIFVQCPDHLQVLNPLYEQIQVSCCLKFKDGLDAEFYRYQLNIDLKKMLAPWAFGTEYEITFGARIYRSAILNFIEERPYVDVVAGFKVVHYFKENGIDKYEFVVNQDEIIPRTPRSILTSMNTVLPGLSYDHDLNLLIQDENGAYCICPDSDLITAIAVCMEETPE